MPYIEMPYISTRQGIVMKENQYQQYGYRIEGNMPVPSFLRNQLNGDWDIALVKFSKNGQNPFYYMLATGHTGSDQYGYHWRYVGYIIASPEENLEACLKVFESINSTYKETNEFSMAVTKYTQQNNQKVQATVAETQQMIAQRESQVSSFISTINQGVEARSRAMQGTSNAVLDQKQVNQNGNTYNVSNQYRRTFMDGRGNVDYSNDPNFVPPAGWKEVK